VNSANQIVDPEFSFFTLSLEFAASSDVNQEEATGEVYWNNFLVGSLKVTKEGVNKFNAKVDAQSGINSISIKSTGSSILVSNIALIRDGTNENIVDNGDFKSVGESGGVIPFWSGKANV
jgi:hypothetical protein